LPKRCDGINLLPFLKGQKSGDAHEYIYWHNADPTDAPRRNLYAVRWKDWRLIKRQKKWLLYDMRKDPAETTNVADNHSDVVANMVKHYEAFVATLPPLKPSADYKGGGKVPQGWGWVIRDGRQSTQTRRRRYLNPGS
jgi:arylsulfatase A-like enzyme